MGLEIGRLKGEERVARRVALVEGVSPGLLHPVPQLLGAIGRDAARRAAGHELVLERCKHRRVLLADGLAQRVGLAGGKPSQHLGDLHELLLVGRHPVSWLQDRLEPLVQVLDALGVVLATLEGGDVVHRAWSVEGVECHQVVEAVGPDLLEHPLHPTRFELEDPEGVPPGEEPQSLLVVQWNSADIGLLAPATANGL